LTPGRVFCFCLAQENVNGDCVRLSFFLPGCFSQGSVADVRA
jgi:hypothetical protein